MCGHKACVADSAAASSGRTVGAMSLRGTAALATDTLMAGAVETCRFPLSALTQPISIAGNV
jgi:hypothetical protein